MIIAIDDILEKQNHSRYWLHKNTGISQNHIADICNGKTASISYDTIAKICAALNCTPNDILLLDDNKKDAP